MPKHILYAVSLFIFSGCLYAQNCDSLRYKEPIFQSVVKIADIEYAQAPALDAPFTFEGNTHNEILTLDFFEPQGDVIAKRPLIILAYGGAFFNGSKNVPDIQAACDSLARLGYTAAALNYRLGWNPVSAASSERAVYRAAQDFSACVRFFKEKAANYRIDTNAIIVGGCSAGSIAALHMAYGDEDERPAASYGQGGILSAPDLGCFDCSGNSYNHSHRVRGVINMWGAIGFLSWIEANDPPILNIHGDADPVVPYGEGYPYTYLAVLPKVYGSQKIHERMQQLNIPSTLHTYASSDHQLWGSSPINFTYQKLILEHIYDFLEQELKPASTYLSGDSAVCSGDIRQYQVPLRSGFSYCWEVQNGNILSQNANTITVLWDSTGSGLVSVREYSPHFFPADSLLSLSVQVGLKPDLWLDLPEDLLCAGDSITVSASGADTFAWQSIPSFNLTPTAAISFVAQGHVTLSVVGTNADGCASAQTVQLDIWPKPQTPVLTQNGNLLYVLPAFYAYQWYKDGQAIPGAETHEYLCSDNGLYSLEVYNIHGCASMSYPVTMAQVGLTEAEMQIGFYPNPVQDLLSWENKAFVSMQISDLSGRIIQIQSLDPLSRSVQLNGLKAGAYIFAFEDQQGKIIRVHILKK